MHSIRGVTDNTLGTLTKKKTRAERVSGPHLDLSGLRVEVMTMRVQKSSAAQQYTKPQGHFYVLTSSLSVISQVYMEKYFSHSN